MLKRSSLPVEGSVKTNLERENGVIVALLALVLPVLFIVVTWGVTASYLALVRSELQTAVDSAAHAGASSISSSMESFEHRSVRAAFLTFLQHRVHGSVGVSTVLALDEVADDRGLERVDGIIMRTWENSSLKLSISRGVTWLTGQDATGFESLDDAGWFSAHTGVPAYSVYNSMRVTAVRKGILPLVLRRLGIVTSVRASATALSDAIEDTCIAPFALPVCALETVEYNAATNRYQSSGYRPDDAVRYQRLFTRADRYCPADEVGCGYVYPSFAVEPKSCNTFFYVPPSGPPARRYAGGPVEGQLWCSGSTSDPDVDSRDYPSEDILALDRSPYWLTPIPSQPSDYFGVLGLPREAANPVSFLDVIQRSGGCAPARIGDRFYILEYGFHSPGFPPDIENIMWNRVTGNIAGAEGEAFHPRFRDTGFRYGEENLMEENIYRLASWPAFSPRLPPSGICNSRRFDEATADSSLSLTEQADLMRTTKVWRVNVPVIADYGDASPPCQSASPSSSPNPLVPVVDPPVNADSEWRIIGFLRVDFYDVDIGRAPPRRDSHYPKTFWYRSAVSTEPPPITGLTSYSFARGNCNLVRGKVAWDADLIPLTPSGIIPERRTVLVQ